MSDARLEVLARFIEAWAAGDLDATLAYLDPAVEIDWSESKAPFRGVYAGIDGYRRLFAELRQSFQAARVELGDAVAAGPRIAVTSTAHMQGRDGIELIARSSLVITFAGDRIVAVKLFQEHPEALRALGVGA